MAVPRTYGKGPLQGNLVLLDALDGGIGNCRLAILENRVDVDGLPLDRGLSRCVSISGLWAGRRWATSGERKFATDLGGSEDVLDGNGDLGANAIALDQADSVATLHTRISRIAHLVGLLLPCDS